MEKEICQFRGWNKTSYEQHVVFEQNMLGLWVPVPAKCRIPLSLFGHPVVINEGLSYGVEADIKLLPFSWYNRSEL